MSKIIFYDVSRIPRHHNTESINRYNVPPPPGVTDEKELEKHNQTIVIPTQVRVGAAIKAWMENHPQDFDYEMTQIVISFCDQIPESLSHLANHLRNVVLQRVNFR